MSNGEDLEAGASVGGETTTELVGQRDLSEQGDFNGNVIFLVRPLRGSDEDHAEPRVRLDAVRGVGNLGGAGLVGSGGGIDDSKTSTQSGAGVHGNGANGSVFADPQNPQKRITIRAGDGVSGKGGTLSRLPPGGGAGVYGEGGEQFGPGVVGVADNHPLKIDDAGNPAEPFLACGVYGKGAHGIRGLGTRSGIDGQSALGRGGVFTTTGDPAIFTKPGDPPPTPGTKQAQIRLVPHEREGVPQLPRNGEPGDLLASSNEDGFAALFFCVQGPSQDHSQPAKWARVQLDFQLIDGNA